MKIFVSYSRRDGVVTERTLRLVAQYLRGIGKPFIHCLQPPKGRWEQASVVYALLCSPLIVLIDSPAARQSPWVKFELALARLLFRPILRLPADDFLLAE